MLETMCTFTSSDKFSASLKFIKLSPEKPFECQVCHKKYSSKKYLNQHKKIHDDSKSFKCDVCLKVFSSKSKLVANYRTHTGKNHLLDKFVIKSLLLNLH